MEFEIMEFKASIAQKIWTVGKNAFYLIFFKFDNLYCVMNDFHIQPILVAIYAKDRFASFLSTLEMKALKNLFSPIGRKFYAQIL